MIPTSVLTAVGAGGDAPALGGTPEGTAAVCEGDCSWPRDDSESELLWESMYQEDSPSRSSCRYLHNEPDSVPGCLP